MKLSTTLSYAGGFREMVQRVVDLERAGLDIVWVAEPYSFDAITQVGYLAAVTERIEIGTGIVNVFSRTAALMAMTAAGADTVSNGRFHLGLGASGPQVVEGFHGVPYERPMTRIIEYIQACRMVWRREPLEFHGATIDVPLSHGNRTGLGKALKLINHPIRPDIPIWWASVMGNSVAATAEHANGWMPIFFDPLRYQKVWGADIQRGLERRDPSLGPLQINAGGVVAIGEHLVGEERDRVLDTTRAEAALYIGGMGAREKNFYNDIACRYGYTDAAREIQDLYLSGKRQQAAAAVPADLLDRIHLVGPKGRVAEKIAAFREAGVTVLAVQPHGDDPAGVVESLRQIVD